MQKVRIWDLPTRIFHWLLAVAITALFISGQVGGNAIDLHGKLGIALVGLIVFRLVWGLVGSTYARFATFFPTPTKIRAYLKGEWQGLGHNPLGALSVFALLGLCLLQALLGLFANDDIAFQGPLFNLVDKDLSDRLTGFHHLLSNLLMALVVVHVAAIGFYARVKKDNLLKPMFTGWKEVEGGESARGGGIVALIVALLLAAAAAWAATGAWLPAPPPAPPAAVTPAW